MATSLPALETVLNGAITNNSVVGTSVCVAHRGELIFNASAGMADKEAESLANPDTIYRLASLTKLVVACTVLAMIDAGEFSLDDPICEHLPYFTPKLGDGTRPIITITQLLSHTAGVGTNSPPTKQELTQPNFIAAGGNFWHLPLEDNIGRLTKQPLLYAPGESWEYSMSIDVLGALVARKVGGTLLDAITKYVTGPLDMHDTLFSVADPARLAKPYCGLQDGLQPMQDPQIVPNDWQGTTTFFPNHIFDEKAYQFGGGGMAGPATDFIKLLIALSAGGAPILSRSMAKQGGLNRVKNNHRVPVYGGYGFGFFGEVIDDNPSRATPMSQGSFGWGGHFGNSWFIDPQKQLAVVALTNTALEGFCGQFPFEVRNAIYCDLR